MEFRPHIMTWTPMGESTLQPGTGYEIPGIPGEPISVPCRFHLGGSKTFKNEDSTEINQIGRIRLDAGGNMPKVRQIITVVDATDDSIIHFTGPVMETYHGQETWRVEV